jgi:hypothetical protein
VPHPERPEIGFKKKKIPLNTMGLYLRERKYGEGEALQAGREAN